MIYGATRRSHTLELLIEPLRTIRQPIDDRARTTVILDALKYGTVVKAVDR